MAVKSAGLRSDFRQWLIYDDESLGAVARALEVAALAMAGQTLLRRPEGPIRLLGRFMVRVASARTEEMLRSDGAQRVAIEHTSKVFNWLAGKAPFPADELDELHAAAFRLDARAQAAGVRGPGTIREAIRGD